MKSPRLNSRNSILTIFIVSIIFIISYGCSSPKTYLKSYSDPDFKPNEIQKLAVVLDDTKLAGNHVLSKLYIQTAIERKKFFLVHSEPLSKNKITNKIRKDVDAFLLIGLTHIYHGNMSTYLPFPTSIGAYSSLVDAKSGKMLWNTKYSYSSYSTGFDAPSIEEAMIIVSNKLIDSVPLEYYAPSIQAKKQTKKTENKKTDNVSKKIVAHKNNTQKVVTPIQIKPAHLNPPAKKNFTDKISPTVKNAKLKVSIEENKFYESDKSKISIGRLKNIQKETKDPINWNTFPKDAKILRKKYYSVQVGAFYIKNEAERRIFFLKEKGYPDAFILPVTNSKGGRWYTVRIGKFSNIGEAQKMVSNISAKVKLESAIRPFGML